MLIYYQALCWLDLVGVASCCCPGCFLRVIFGLKKKLCGPRPSLVTLLQLQGRFIADFTTKRRADLDEESLGGCWGDFGVAIFCLKLVRFLDIALRFDSFGWC